MPTSPRDLTGGTGGYQPTAQFSTLRADEGHRPLRAWIALTVHRTPSFVYRGPLHTRPGLCPVHPRKAQRAAPHPSGLRRATLFQERVFPSSGPGCARSTFPVGEGFLRRGRSLAFPWGKVPPQRRKRGGTKSVLRTAPHPSGLRRATLSQERVFLTPVPALPVHPLVRRGFFPHPSRLRPAILS